MPERSLDDWLGRIERLHPSEIEMGLERVYEVAQRLEVLRPAPLSVIVAGTNGKGSTAVFTESLLLAMGYSVGTTLSPHVERFNERVRINGSPCSDAALCESFTRVEAARGEVPLTYFEFAALVALTSFYSTAVDVAILEVGLGGRLDAFNIVDAQIAAVTSIGLDHEDYLGDDLEQIGAEKAGVFRRAQTVVLGDSITRSVSDRASELGCDVYRAEVDFTLTRSVDHWSFDSPGLHLMDLPWGALAAENCALGIVVADRVNCATSTTSRIRSLNRDVVLGALNRAWLPGRFEFVRHDGRGYILDVAHNPLGAAFLCEQLVGRGMGRMVAIIGSLRDKDTAGIITSLKPVLERVICVGVEGERGLSADELGQRLGSKFPHQSSPNLDGAVEVSRSLTEAGDVILVCGCFAIVAHARSLLGARSTVATDSLS